MGYESLRSRTGQDTQRPYVQKSRSYTADDTVCSTNLSEKGETVLGGTLVFVMTIFPKLLNMNVGVIVKAFNRYVERVKSLTLRKTLF